MRCWISFDLLTMSATKVSIAALYSTRLAALGVDRVVGIDMEVCSNWVRLVIYSIDVEVIVNRSRMASCS